jgi:hypothetical protein
VPVGPGRYRVVQTPKGPVRLHFGKKGAVNEAKNLKSGAVHTPAEFKADRKKSGADDHPHNVKASTVSGKDLRRKKGT